MEMLAIQQIEKGRLDIKTAVPEAVKTLVAGLQATDRRGPDWRSRLEAANSIIRLATEQTGSTTQNLTVITAHTQIGKIYNEGTENSLLAAGEGSDLAQESPIIDGEFSETSSETTAENPSAATNEGRTTPSRPPAPLVNNGRTQEGSSHEKDATAQGLLTSLQQAPVLQELDESQRTAVLQLLNKYTTGHTTTNEPELELEEPHTEKKTSTPSRKES
jgi:pyruvate/2-oxoglutarate dehydrogenase complex dihydrolipoamide acyltransferase (E2) component